MSEQVHCIAVLRDVADGGRLMGLKVSQLTAPADSLAVQLARQLRLDGLIAKDTTRRSVS